MPPSFEIKIEPYEFYHKYEEHDYALCGISFDFFDDEKHCFPSECSDQCLLEILKKIDDYFDGKIVEDTELYYDVPWIFDGVDYPFSFKIDVQERQWLFRYKKSTNAEQFDFVYPMNEADVRSMRDQLESEYNKVDWKSLGKSELYSFDLPPKEFQWCYSAKAFESALNSLCVGKKIKSIYVSAMNYADPLRVAENYINYYLGSEVFIVFDGGTIDLLIHASGLFEWRSFDESEMSIIGPRLDFIRDGDKEFCNIQGVYKAFKLKYTGSQIDEVSVRDTDCWPWNTRGFDKSQLGSPIELPEEVFFKLENGNTLSFVGWDDDFAIKISATGSQD